MDTIAAVATGSGVSAIGVLRVSGPAALTAADAVFRPRDGRPLSAHAPRAMVFGALLGPDGEAVDECLAVVFPGPHSYTGEDSAEFHCHGSPIVLQEGLAALFANGARQAGPGEFTRQAFLNGRLDLTEAEAVIDLIDAESAAAAKNALAQLGGSLRRLAGTVREALVDVASRFYAVVDYPDEDIGDVRPEDIAAALRRSEEALTALLATFRRGQVLRSGVPTAILGRPNAGKSSLLNALLGYERAIVTDIPGTTRDTVEEKCVVGGVLLRLIDTAGLRETEDAVEKMGTERARRAAEDAGLVLALVDGSRPFTPEDAAILRLAGEKAHWILVLSKSDLPREAVLPELSGLTGTPPAAVIPLSARTGAGMAELEASVSALFSRGEAPGGSLLTNPRQADAVGRALDAVRRAEESLSLGMTPDVILTDAEEALSALGELTGSTAREDITDAIFSRFCVGK